MSGAVALIPARGGSRRIPRKNVRPFLGVPAIKRVINTVVASGIVDRIVVSTDDHEVASIARDAGAEVPSLRPPELADDHTTTLAVVQHAIETWFSELEPSDHILVVYPTALLLTPDSLREASHRFAGSDADFLVPVLRYPHPVERRLRIDEAGRLRPDEPGHVATRSQDLDPAYHDSGQFYIGLLAAWKDDLSPLAEGRAIAWELAADDAVDIDEPADWARAERLAQLRRAAPS